MLGLLELGIGESVKKSSSGTSTAKEDSDAKEVTEFSSSSLLPFAVKSPLPVKSSERREVLEDLLSSSSSKSMLTAMEETGFLISVSSKVLFPGPGLLKSSSIQELSEEWFDAL